MEKTTGNDFFVASKREAPFRDSDPKAHWHGLHSFRRTGLNFLRGACGLDADDAVLVGVWNNPASTGHYNARSLHIAEKAMTGSGALSSAKRR